MLTFDAILSNWSLGAGMGHDAALMHLGATSAFLEARKQHKAGASERVVRLQLDKALHDVGMTPIRTD